MAKQPDEYGRAAEIVFEQMTEMKKFSLEMMGEYGRWLISSLLLLHGSAIAGLLFKAAGTAPPPYLSALWWFVAGIVMAFAAGYCAWINFSMAAESYDHMADHRMLSDRNHWPTPIYKSEINLTWWAANVTGLLSVACIVAGAVAVVCSWR